MQTRKYNDIIGRVIACGFGAIILTGFGVPVAERVYRSTIAGDWSQTLLDGRKMSYSSRWINREPRLELTDRENRLDKTGGSTIARVTIAGEGYLFVEAFGRQP